MSILRAPSLLRALYRSRLPLVSSARQWQHIMANDGELEGGVAWHLIYEALFSSPPSSLRSTNRTHNIVLAAKLLNER